MPILFFLILSYCFWLPVFLIQKPIFLFFNREMYGATLSDYADVMLHGLPLDATVAGYLTALPFVALLLALWLRMDLSKAFLYYVRLMAVVVAAVFAVDVALYSYWGFRLDATLFFYLASPKDAMASVPLMEFALQSLLFVLYFVGIDCGYRRFVLPRLPKQISKRPWMETICFLLAGGLIFLSIRGGIGTSTQNVGKVYYSKHQFLNHAAINPCFSLLASLSKQQDFAAQFDFYPEAERAAVFDKLLPVPKEEILQDTLLTHTRPNVLLILLESFSAGAMKSLGGVVDAMPHLDALSREGVNFTNIYANSFRTDRGLVAVLNGYPAQPTTSIMKYPAKSQSLPSIASSLSKVGYTNDMLYGGDINFTNMKSYFYASGYGQLTADTDFPLATRLNKWGANDDYTFAHLLQELKGRPTEGAPWMTTFLTLSSHEPFEVPYDRLADPYFNSVAFTDSCLGHFINELKQTPVWDNLLVVCVADHGFRYANELTEYEPRRYHIPMLWLGGVIGAPRTIDRIGSQTDLAKTLLMQLGLPIDAFRFSKDLLNESYSNYAFYTFNNGFGFIDSTGVSVYDNEGERILMGTDNEECTRRLQKGKVLLQTLYDDLGSR